MPLKTVTLRAWWRPRAVRPTLHVATLTAEVATQAFRKSPRAQAHAVPGMNSIALAQSENTETAGGQIARMCATEHARSAMTAITRSQAQAQSVLSAQRATTVGEANATAVASETTAPASEILNRLAARLAQRTRATQMR